MVFTIRVLPAAHMDIRRIAMRIMDTVSAASAGRWNTGIIAAIFTLSNSPDRCPEADESADLKILLRVLLYGRRRHVYRILFTIDGEVVNIHRVRHAAQQYLTEDDL